MRLSLTVGLIALLSSSVEGRKKKTQNAVQTAQPTQQVLDFAGLERGRRRKRKKVIPVKRFNYLFARIQQFQNNNLESNHKKMNNKTRKFKTMMLKNLGTMRQRQPRCMPIEESKKYKRQQNQKERRYLFIFFLYLFLTLFS